MRYLISRGEPIHQALQRILVEQNRSALQALESWQSDPADRIHKARRAIKMFRAALRLVRPTSPYVYATENRAFREAGDRLSRLRDSTAVSEALGYLEAHAEVPDYAPALRNASAALVRIEAEALFRNQRDVEARCFRAMTDLCSALSRLELMVLNPVSKAHLKLVTNKRLSKCARLFERAVSRPMPENLHSLRRHAKAVYFHTRLVKELRPHWSARYHEPLGKLDSLLGMWRDLYMLGRVAEAQYTADREAAFWPTVIGLIPNFQQQLWGEAVGLGRDTLQV